MQAQLPAHIQIPRRRAAVHRQRLLRRVIDDQDAAQVERDGRVGHGRADELHFRQLAVEVGQARRLPCAQRLQLLHGEARKTQPVRRAHELQFHRERHALIEHHVRAAASQRVEMAPRHLDATAIGRVREGLPGVDGVQSVHGTRLLQTRRLGDERAPVERADRVLAVRRRQDPARARLALDRQLEEIGALVEEPALVEEVAVHVARERPVLQVRRGEDRHAVPFRLHLAVHGQHPEFAGRVPDDFRIAVRVNASLHGDLRPLRVVAPVKRPGDALRVGFARRRVDQHVRAFPESRGIRVVRHGAAGEHRPVAVGRNHVAEIRPAHEVLRDGVSPVHVAPADAEWVVLIEHVPFAVAVGEPVRIVVPAEGRSEVELRTPHLAVLSLRRGEPRVGKRQVGSGDSRYVLAGEAELQRPPLEAAQVERTGPVRRDARPLDLVVRDARSAVEHLQQDLRRAVLHGHRHVAPRGHHRHRTRRQDRGRERADE